MSRKESIYDTSNWFSRYFYVFIWKLIARAKNEPQSVKDEHFDDFEPQEVKILEAGQKLEANYEKYRNSKSLVSIILITYGRKIAGIALIKSFLTCICQPLLLYLTVLLIDLISKFPAVNEDEYQQKKLELIVLAVEFALLVAIVKLFAHPFYWNIHLIAREMRSALSFLIYKKSMRICKSSELDCRQSISLIGRDADRVESFLTELIDISDSPIECLVVTGIVAKSVDYQTALMLLLLLSLVGLQRIYCSWNFARQVREVNKVGDLRVMLADEAIRAVRLIRMLVWTDIYLEKLEKIRGDEISKIKPVFSTIALDMSSYLAFSSLAPVLTLMFAHYLRGVELSQAVVSELFLVTIVYLRTLSIHLPLALKSISALKVIFKRVDLYLRASEVCQLQTCEDKQTSIRLKHVQASWSGSQNVLLQDINFEANSNQFVVINGSVGSGKSSLLQVILGELPISDGLIELSGKLSYASQSCWIFSGTVRENILVGSQLNWTRYKQVLSVCSLLPDLRSFSRLDLTLIGERGVTLSGGQKARVSLARCIYQEADIYLLDDPLSAVDAQVAEHIFSQALRGFLANKCVILVTHQLKYATEADKVFVLEQLQDEGFSGRLETRSEKADRATRVEFHPNDAELLDSLQLLKMELTDEDCRIADRRSCSAWKDLKFYLMNGTGWMSLIGFVSLNMMIRAFSFGLPLWLSAWIGFGSESRKDLNAILSYTIEGLEFSDAMMVSFGVCFAIAILAVSRSLHLCCIMLNASANIHRKLVGSVMKAKMSFLDSMSHGQLLSRISADISFMDSIFIQKLDEMFIALVGTSFMLLSIALADTTMIVVICSICLITFILFRLCLDFFSLVKRVDGTRIGLIQEHVSITLDGLSTIRASSKQQQFVEGFIRIQDRHSSARFLNKSVTFLIQNVFSLTFVIFTCLLLTKDVFNTLIGQGMFAFVGLNLLLHVNKMSARALQQFLNLYSNLEAINRISNYSKLPSELEDPRKDQLNISDLAISRSTQTSSTLKFSSMQIEFVGVSLRYNQSDEIAIRDLSFCIKSGEKIGIVGRTGAGKSSIVSILFRLYHFEGFVLIDGKDTKQVELDSLRRQISIIPQDPVLFSGSLRHNLDPLNEHSDEQIWSALAAVESKQLAADHELGLERSIAESGANLSAGQRQLVCLARAILQRNKLLVLDEATASVDSHTDRLIQRTIRAEFADCTVITIAHRLNTVIDSDRIMVIDSGRLVEFASPSELLAANKQFALMYSRAE